MVRALRVRTLREARRIAALLDARVWRLFDAVRKRSMSEHDTEALIERLCDSGA
jgi:hypothetical protein